MNTVQNTNTTQAERESFEADVVQQVRSEVQETILIHAPATWSDQQCEEIEENIMAHTKNVVSGLPTSELMSADALQHVIETAVAKTKLLICERKTMKDTILERLARSTLLPGDMAAAILAGDAPPLKDILDALLIGSLDCQATVVADTRSTLNEKRIGRACGIIAFLTAIANTNER
jgi:hypothetical protein